MKRIFAILFGLLAFLSLAVIGTVLIMPEDELTATLRPLPLVGAHTEDIIDYKNDTSETFSYIVEDTVYGVKSRWRRITDFSFTNRKQKVVIELTPVRRKKPKIQQSVPTPVAPPPAPLTKTEDPYKTEVAEPEPNPEAVPEAMPEMTSETAPEMTPEAAPETTPKQLKPELQEHANAPITETPETEPAAAPEPINKAPSLPPTPAPIKKVEKKQVAAVEPAKQVARKPISPPPPAPETDTGADEHKTGLNYYKGTDGVTQNYKAAADLFLKSAAKGNAASQYNLGIMSYLGQGMEQSYEQAAKWFEQAAKQDHALAQYNLGFLFYKGKGVPKDDLQAFMWIDRAARLGDKKAIEARDTLEQNLPKDILRTK